MRKSTIKILCLYARQVRTRFSGAAVVAAGGKLDSWAGDRYCPAVEDIPGLENSAESEMDVEAVGTHSSAVSRPRIADVEIPFVIRDGLCVEWV